MSGARRRRPVTVARYASTATVSREHFWGWHRLRSEWAETLVADAGLGPADLVLLRLRLPRRRFRVVANPPWSLAKPLIRALTAPGSAMVGARLVLPRGLVADFARRLDNGSGRDSGFRGGYARSIPAVAFRPRPPAPAAVLQLLRRH